jgi:CelD/BcsL family acetyltransferase involved in cellulose biosynthesis
MLTANLRLKGKWLTWFTDLVEPTRQQQSNITSRSQSGADNMKVDILDHWEQVETLEPEWNSLLVTSKANTIFLTWEWISTWAKAGGKMNPPFVICVRDVAGNLVGIAPFYMSKLRLSNIIPYRTLRIMADVATGAEYPDLIVSPQAEQEVTRIMIDTLVRSRSRWDCLWLPNVASWTGAEGRLLNPCHEAGLVSRARPCDFGVVELPDNMNAYLRALSSNKRQQLRAETKRISRRTAVSIKRCEMAGQIPRFLEALFDLHHRRWKTREEEGSFRRKPQLVEFYKQFVPRAHERGWLWLFALEDQAEIKAVQLGYVYNNTFCQIQEGFDPDYEKGVGNVLRAHVIEACITAGVSTFDFLGEMSEHKRRWGAQIRTGSDLFIGRQRLKNKPLFSVGLWPTGRFLRPSL